MSNDPIIRFEVTGATLDDLRAFVEEARPAVERRPIARRSERGFVMHASLPETRFTAARALPSASRVHLEVVENAEEAGRAGHAEVGVGNRFADRRAIPRGPGHKG